MVELKVAKGRDMQIIFTETGKNFAQEKIIPIVDIEKSALVALGQKDSRELLRLTRKHLDIFKEKTKQIRWKTKLRIYFNHLLGVKEKLNRPINVEDVDSNVKDPTQNVNDGNVRNDDRDDKGNDHEDELVSDTLILGEEPANEGTND